MCHWAAFQDQKSFCLSLKEVHLKSGYTTIYKYSYVFLNLQELAVSLKISFVIRKRAFSPSLLHVSHLGQWIFVDAIWLGTNQVQASQISGHAFVTRIISVIVRPMTNHCLILVERKKPTDYLFEQIKAISQISMKMMHLKTILLNYKQTWTVSSKFLNYDILVPVLFSNIMGKCWTIVAFSYYLSQ